MDIVLLNGLAASVQSLFVIFFLPLEMSLEPVC